MPALRKAIYPTLIRIAEAIGPTGKLLCVEPNPETYFRLQRNISINRYAHVTAWNVAVGEQGSATPYFNRAENWNRNATIVDDPDTDGRIAVDIQVVALDALWTKQMTRRRVSFVNIDVDGWELTALRSGLRPLRACRPLIISEYSAH
jgi:FkbM family methyltransferase